MSGGRRLILVSQRPEDVQFFEAVARDLGLVFMHTPNFDTLFEAVTLHGDVIIAWDFDHDGSSQPEHPLSHSSVLAALGDHVDPARVFVLTDKTANQCSAPLAEGGAPQKLFQHNILRHYDESGFKLLARVLFGAFAPSPSGIVGYFPEGTQIQKLTLKKADHRPVAVNAVESFLNKLAVDQRIAAKVAQATDELLMNAIFDAAIDRDGNRTRGMLDRKAKFDLGPREHVDIEFAATDEYFGLCVTDHYGSLGVESIMKSLGQNYYGSDYQLRKMGPGAGLGLYGVVEGGLSLLMVCEPKKRTDSLIFFPRTNSYRAFKAGFRFSSCNVVKT